MAKFVVYQVLPRLFGNKNLTNRFAGTIHENGCGKLNDIDSNALDAIRSLGVTHVWYTGVIEHATQTDYSKYGIRRDCDVVVKGKAGSPYAIKDYYDIDPDLAVNVPQRMVEFEQLVKRTHAAGMKVVIDFVPNHVAREYYSDSKPQGVVDLGELDHSDWAFSPLNNFYYIPNQAFSPGFEIGNYVEYPAKATGNDQFVASPGVNDWYETVKLNYGVNYVEGGQKQFDPIPDTWIKMRDILLYWASKGVDAFRCDMAEMVPVEFWGWVIPKVKAFFEDIRFIAEVYNPAEYHNYIFNGKFDYLYDKVGLYDILKNITMHHCPASDITRSWQSLEGIGCRMLNFLENHDEQRVASDFFLGRAELAIPAMIVSATLSKGPVMIYMGQELGERGMDNEGFSGVDGRTTIFDYWGLKSIQDWSNGGVYDGKYLSGSQRTLQNFYKNLLKNVLSEKAISEGGMYDLEYANFNTPGFDSNRHFAFFRVFKEEYVLVIVNFSVERSLLNVSFPCDLFRYLGISEGGVYGVCNLMDSQSVIADFSFTSAVPFAVHVEASSGVILKFKKLIEA